VSASKPEQHWVAKMCSASVGVESEFGFAFVSGVSADYQSVL